ATQRAAAATFRAVRAGGRLAPDRPLPYPAELNEPQPFEPVGVLPPHAPVTNAAVEDARRGP
ncbi:MAG TPA: hypothetical protein VGD56_22020, partial [Gemmatirosa sp.]